MCVYVFVCIYTYMCVCIYHIPFILKQEGQGSPCVLKWTLENRAQVVSWPYSPPPARTLTCSLKELVGGDMHGNLVISF